MVNGKSGTRRAFDPAGRMGIAAFVVVVGFAFLFIRLGYIQLGQYGGQLDRYSDRHWSSMYIQHQRGLILDRAGRVMSASVEGRSLYAHPQKIKDRNRLAVLLTRLGILSLEESMERLSAPKPFVWLAHGIDIQQWNGIKKEFSGIEGVEAMPEWRRRYPLDKVGANVIGFVGSDGRGLAGVEFMLDQELAGDIESLHVEIGDHGLPVILDSQGHENPVFRGRDVQLTLDAYVQESVDHVLAETVDACEAKGGSIVVLNPRTGEIIAMGSEPSFDPNNFSDFPPAQYKNQAINTVFEPGSTFKIVTLAALATDRRTALSENVICNGSISIPGVPKPIHCYASHGPVTFREAIEASCNVGVIHAALELEPEQFYRMVQSFGFGIPTGVGLPGEEKGILRKPYQWSGSTRAVMAIGQEIAVTNLQMAMAMSVIANGGDLIKPQIVLKPPLKPQIVRNVIRPEIAAIARDFLLSVVEGDMGTGKKAKVAGVRVGGKTGTAQIADPRGGYAPDRFLSSFIGFLPAESPQLVISVWIHEPNPAIAHFGGDVAAPAFAKIAASAMKFLNIPTAAANP